MKNLILLILFLSIYESNAQNKLELKIKPFTEVELSNNKSLTLISKDIDKTFLLIKDEAHTKTYIQAEVIKVNDFFKSKPYILDYSAGANFTYKIYIMPGHEIEVMQNWLGFTIDDINKITE